MASASANIFWGIFVSTPSLIFAVDAEALVKSPRKSISLIQQRQTKEFHHLTTREDSIPTRFPVEIWNLILDFLYPLALEQAEKDFINSVRCGKDFLICLSEGNICEEGNNLCIKDRWSKWGEVPSCRYCQWKAEAEINRAFYGGRRRLAVDELLLRFGLKLVSRESIRPNGSYRLDLTALSPITIVDEARTTSPKSSNSTKKEKSHSLSQKVSAYDEYEDERAGHEIVTIDRRILISGFENRDKNEKKFESLRKLYKVKARDPMISQGHTVAMLLALGLGLKRSSSFESGTKPRLLLWTRAEMDI